MNTQEAFEKLTTLPDEELQLMCMNGSLDLYGGVDVRLTIPIKNIKIDWWMHHYFWNEETQCWHSKIPHLYERQK